MSEVTFVEVPYHLGREGVGIGAGPEALRAALGTGTTVRIERAGEFRNEVSASFTVVRAIADAVRKAAAGGSFPIVLAGNCGSSLGTVAGLGPDDLGVVWFDAHADFHTPDTSPGGFLDGMALAMLTGSGWAAARRTVGALRPVAEEHVVLVGARSIDPGEDERLERSAVAHVRRPPVEPALDALAERVRDVYLHVDLDVLDPSEGRANGWAEDDGLTLSEVEDAVGAVADRFQIRALALTAYDPACDPERRIPYAASAIAARARRAIRPEAAAR
jgi:arginase